MQRSGLKASDADREAVAERLRNAAAEGRLLAHELEERVARVLRSRTYGELDAVVADLPANPRRSHPAVPLLRPALAVAIAIATIAVLAAVALVITGLLAFWGLWMVIAWWAFGRRWGYGPRRPGSGPPRPGSGPPRSMRRGGPLQVPRSVRHADRRAWL